MEWVGITAVVAASAAMPVDEALARRFQYARQRDGRSAEQAASALNAIGGPGTVVAPLTLIVGGWITHRAPLFDVGIHAAEAVVAGSGVTFLIKGVAGRARPVAGANNARSFSWGRGFGQEQFSSFPSGHATSAFAFATVIAMVNHSWRKGGP